MFPLVHSLAGLTLLASSTVARAESASLSPEPSAVRVYMRSDGEPLLFSARASTSRVAPNACVSPCNVQLSPGDYTLRLNGVLASDSLALRTPGTLYGQYHSQRALRDGGFLALNVGGIIGGVFITVAVLGGPSWAYVAGGGSVAAGGLIFFITYRSDSATISFSPEEPLDARGMPAPAPLKSPVLPERPGARDESRGFGLRVVF